MLGELVLQLLVALAAMMATVAGGSVPVQVIGLDTDVQHYSAEREPYVDTFWTNATSVGSDGFCTLLPTGREVAAGELREWRLELGYPGSPHPAQLPGGYHMCRVSVNHCPGAVHLVDFSEDGGSHAIACIDARCWTFNSQDGVAPGVNCSEPLWQHRSYPVIVRFHDVCDNPDGERFAVLC